MFASFKEFYNFAARLWIESIRRPEQLGTSLQDVPLDRCLKFGWLCFFIGSLLSAGSQYLFVSKLLHQVAEDPSFSLEVAKSLSLLEMPSMDGWKDKLELIKLSSYAAVFLSPVAAFVFLHLISGALYVVSKAISPPKVSDGAYERVMKIVAVGQAPVIFCAFPVFGPILGSLWSIWLIARLLGSVFSMSMFARLGIVTFSFVFLFSFWNSTVSKIVGAYYFSEKTVSAQNFPERESSQGASDLI